MIGYNMTKQQAREQNPKSVMLCREGSFYTFYDMDALIVNKLCGHKIIPCGQRPKAGVPLKHEAVSSKLEENNVSYIVFKSDEGIQRRFDASNNAYEKISAKIIAALAEQNISVERYFSKKNEANTTENKATTVNKLEFLASGNDPYTGVSIQGMSEQTIVWLQKLNIRMKDLVDCI